jgi:hypothetical protein
VTLKATDPAALKRQFPHVDDVKDWRAQQSLRLLWDRIFALEERLQSVLATQGDLVSATNRQDDQLTAVDRKADEALAIAQGTRAEIEQGVLDNYPLPGGGDGGMGALGCSEATSSGDITVTGLTAREAGKVVCGTGAEHATLLVATVDQPTRDANAEELVRRMIWHLQQAGFTAGRQQNPSGAISKDKLTVIVDGLTRAYDVFVGKNNFAVAMTTAMQEVAPPVLVADAGIPD